MSEILQQVHDGKILSKEDKENRIHNALIDKNENAVKLMILLNLNPNLLYNKNTSSIYLKKYDTPLMVATRLNWLDMIQFLIDHGSEIDLGSVDNFACSPLIHGNYDSTKLLLENGADVNFIGEWLEEPPLKLACWYGNTNIVKLLIDYNCDINWSDNDGYSALHDAVDRGHLDIVKILVNNGSDLNKCGGFNANEDTGIYNQYFDGTLFITPYWIACYHFFQKLDTDIYYQIFLYLKEKNCILSDYQRNMLYIALSNSKYDNRRVMCEYEDFIEYDSMNLFLDS